MPTSNSAADRYAQRTWWFVYGVWTAMTIQALVFVIRYTHADPVADEWDFVPAVAGRESFWPWLWKLHNEHRFVLSRLIWLPLIRLTEDFGAGCYVSLAGVSLFSIVMIQLAGRLRGRLHFTDAFMPLSLLHVGHWENLYMGYQLVFMMNLVFAGILLRIILLTNRTNLLTRGWQAGIVTLLLLGCGAGGLAFGPFMAIWFAALMAWWLLVKPRPPRRYRVLPLLFLTAIVPLYIGLYLHEYARPSRHQDPIDVWGSRAEAAWQALRSAMQAASMSIGPAAIRVWPASAFTIGLIAIVCAWQLVRVALSEPEERPRSVGLLVFLGAVAFLSYGIGWGRCVFRIQNNHPGIMGLSSRYGWIVWPGLGLIYFQWLIYGGPRLSRWIPLALFGMAVVALPFNVVTGFTVGKLHREEHAAWEKSVKEDMSDEEFQSLRRKLLFSKW